jgi:hypothetical protein
MRNPNYTRHRPWHAHTREAIYAYRANKPNAIIGLTFIGRHWVYVGRTNDLERRDAEHMIGGGRYDAVAKQWADLRPRRYVICKLRRRREWRTHLLERLFILLFLPVYNVQYNSGNPRRIRRVDQMRQRAARDRGRLPGVVAGAGRLLPTYLRAAEYLLSLALVVVAFVMLLRLG